MAISRRDFGAERRQNLELTGQALEPIDGPFAEISLEELIRQTSEQLPVEAFLNYPDDSDDVAMQRTLLSGLNTPAPGMLEGVSPLYGAARALDMAQALNDGLVRKINPALTRDLTHDETAVRLLYAWSRRPRDTAIALILTDRMRELCFDKEATALEEGAQQTVDWIFCDEQPISRRLRQRRIKEWRVFLRNNYGDFEKRLQELSERGKLTPEATTPL